VGYLREYLDALWRINKLIRRLSAECQFGVVHACNPPDFLLAAACHSSTGERVCCSIITISHLNFTNPDTNGGVRSTFGLRPAERLAFLAADAVITTNESYRSTPRATRIASDSPNTCEGEPFHPLSRDSQDGTSNRPSHVDREPMQT